MKETPGALAKRLAAGLPRFWQQRATTIGPPHVLYLLAGGLTALGVYNFFRDRKVTSRFRAGARSVEVDGVSLRYLEASGPVVVLLHGNGSLAEDFVDSGVMRGLAGRFRTIAFDRPGFGGSTRPRLRRWNPARQADLLHAALRGMGIERCTVVGHSWGASVALQYAIRHGRSVDGVVVLSGYYFPTPRIDALLAGVPALPLLGDLLCHTVLPVAVRLAWPLVMKKVFGPNRAPPALAAAMRSAGSRAGQLRATAAESAELLGAAMRGQSLYASITGPAGIMGGTDDRLIDAAGQARQLAREIPQAELELVEGAGHMVHHAAAGRVIAMVERVAAASRRTVAGLVRTRPSRPDPYVYGP